MSIDSSRWIAQPKRDPGGMRLICVPYAGGGTAVFRGWDATFPELAVCPVKLPGRETRFVDPAPSHIDPLVDELAPTVESLMDRPYALFGHSMGAIIVFELARRLRDRGHPSPRHLFVAGRQAPHIADPVEPCYQLPDAEFTDALRARYGSTSPAFQHPELIELMLPTLRADCAVCETYRCRTGEPLDCPITAFGGADDKMVSAVDLAAWSEHTGGAFASHEIAGDHFFVDTNREPMLALMREALSAA